MSITTLTGEAFGLSKDLVMVGEGPTARRARTRASESMRKAIIEAKGLLDAAWAGDPVARLRVNEAITTSDLFRSAAGEYLDRILLADYERVTPSWRAYAAETKLRNFKPKKLQELNRNTGPLPSVPERTDYPVSNIDGAEREISVGKFGEQYGYTWEARVNDEIGELEQVPRGWSYQTAVTESQTALSQMVNTLTGAPNAAFFNAGNDNLGTGALTDANLQAAITKVTTKKDSAGNLLVAPQLKLVVGPALQFTAERVINTTEIRVTDGTVTTLQSNPFRGKVTLEVLPDLPGTAWFLLPEPGPGRKSAFYVGKLIGYETPDLRYQANQGSRVGGGSIAVGEGSFVNDTIWYRVRHIVGAAQGDPTFTYASDGLAA